MMNVNLLREGLFGATVVAMVVWAIVILLRACKLFLIKHMPLQHADAVVLDKMNHTDRKNVISYYVQVKFADCHKSKVKVSKPVYDSCRQGQRLIVGYQQPIGVMKRHITSIH